MNIFLRTSSGVAPSVVCLVALLSATSIATAATRIALVIDEPLQARTVPWPVTTGVPFPRGALQDAENCRLVDDSRKEVPLQSRVAATWDPKRASIRWLTIDFVAQPGRSYALEFGPEVRRKPLDSALVITEGAVIRVATGVLQADFAKDSPAGLANVSADLNGDRNIAPDEVVVTSGDDGDHFYVDQQGRRYTSGRDGDQRHIVVEARGPVRSCIRVDGFYTGPDGSRIVQYRTRYHFFAGLGLVKLVDEFRIIGSTKETRFTEIGLAWKLWTGVKHRVVTVDASGDDGNQPLQTPWRPETSSVASFQSTYRHYGNPECQAAVVETDSQGEQQRSKSERIGEWMQVADRRAAVTGSLRWLWQQFPKSWEATSDRLIVRLWDRRGGELDFSEAGIKNVFGPEGRRYLLEAYPQPFAQTNTRFMMDGTRASLALHEGDGRGVNKHHELFLHFGPAEKAAQGQEYATLAARPPLALASGAWNCETDVFGPLAQRPNDSKHEAIVDRIFDLSRYAQDAFGDYGWWIFGSGPHYSYQWDANLQKHYADPRRFEYHTYQKETQLWWCYLRSGERKFYDWAIPSENHWVDIAVSHQPLRYESQWLGAESFKQTLDWPVGDWSIDGAAHYLRHHDTGEAWLRGGAQYWASYHRTLETTALAQYLTGDERFNDVLDYWRQYFGDLAGKTSASTDLQPWHRQQAWFRPTAAGEPTRTWAEMIRDYAPFDSGSRHQHTLLFNLATLYEHTWDPRVGQALREYADAFLDPEHPIGVWRCQDHRLPAKAEVPAMAHFWTPALWKYARATQDPRMPTIFAKYFAACAAADPFREDLGVYSNVQQAYAYYFTRDPRHLRPALRELDRLQPFAAPLKNPQEINERLYNPYAPIASLTAVPRLISVLQQAQAASVELPPPEPMRPQRTAIAIHKAAGTPLIMTLWGFDSAVMLLDPNGDAFAGAEVSTTRAATDLQPFDRVTPGFEVFTHQVTIPASAPEGYYLMAPKLELAILRLKGAEGALANASRPIAIEPGEEWKFRAPVGAQRLAIESSPAATLSVTGPRGALKLVEKQFELAPEDAGAICRIQNAGRGAAWFRIADLPEEQCWVALGELPKSVPARAATLAALEPRLPFDPQVEFVAGRFGQAIQLHADRQLRFPDRISTGETTKLLFGEEEGTLEFWVRKLWDDRLQAVPPVTYFTNEFVRVTNPGKLRLGEWTHVAVVWRRVEQDEPLRDPALPKPSRTLVHVYIDGVDTANYRNFWWLEYGDRPFEFARAEKLPGEFNSRFPAGAAAAIDELRLSSTARYADRKLQFGHRQAYNSFHFNPPTEPFTFDSETKLLLHFDGDPKATPNGDGTTIEAKFSK